jgi:hypothetical protein
VLPLGIATIDAALGGGLARGALHEVASFSESHIAAVSGFRLARCDKVRRPVIKQPAHSGRQSRRAKLMHEMPELVADFEVTARVSARAPNRRAGY